jgi:DNA-binding NarL/FixJ family response regulator
MIGLHDTAAIRVLVVYRNEICLRGVQACVSETPSIRIVGTERESQNAVEAARRLGVNVVVVEESAPGDTCGVLATLLEIPNVRRVITLSLGDVSGRVYERHLFQLGEPGSLIRAIQGGL